MPNLFPFFLLLALGLAKSYIHKRKKIVFFFFGWRNILIFFFLMGGKYQEYVYCFSPWEEGGRNVMKFIFIFSHMFFFGGTYIVVELGYCGLLIPLFLYFGFGY